MATTLNGAFEIKVPQDLIIMMKDRKDNSSIKVDIETTSQITELFASSKFQIQRDDKIPTLASLTYPMKELNIVETLSVYYKTYDGDSPKILC